MKASFVALRAMDDKSKAKEEMGGAFIRRLRRLGWIFFGYRLNVCRGQGNNILYET